MKNIKYIFSLLVLLPFISSCEKDIMDYEGEDGLYFDAQWDTNPSINTDTTKWIRQHYTLVNFAKEGGMELEASAKIAISGSVKDYDRPISFKVVADSTTAIADEEYELLELLVLNAGKVYSREKLLALVWGADYPGDLRTVDVHIRRLREKIEKNPSEPSYVHTKWGVGYYYLCK